MIFVFHCRCQHSTKRTHFNIEYQSMLYAGSMVSFGICFMHLASVGSARCKYVKS